MSEGNGERIILPDEAEKPKTKVVFQVEANAEGHLQMRNFTSDLGLLSYAFRIAEMALSAMIMQTEQTKRQPIVTKVPPPMPGAFLNGLRGGFRKKTK